MKSHLVPVRFNNKMAFFFEPWRTQEQSESFVQGIYRNVKSSLEAPWKRLKGCCVMDSCTVLDAVRVKVSCGSLGNSLIF